MKKGIVITGIILLLLVLTNPTPRDFEKYIEANGIRYSSGGRVAYCGIVSVYQHNDTFYSNSREIKTEYHYLGVFKNFIAL